MKKYRRVFIAISIPAEIQKDFALLATRWPELPARWVPESTMHITVAFLGYISDVKLGGLCVSVKEVARRHQPFLLECVRVCYGPEDFSPDEETVKSLPRLVWVALKPSRELASLRRDIEDNISGTGEFRGGERFTPHITLARINTMAFRAIDIDYVPRIRYPVDISLAVQSVEVMESVSGRQGLRYDMLESFSFSDG